MEPNQLTQSRTAFKRAIFALGDQSKMAELLGISRQAVSHRILRNKAPVQTMAELELIESTTGVSRHDLRPDLYPREEPVPAHQPAPQPPAQHPAAHPPASNLSPCPGPDAGGPVPAPVPALDYNGDASPKDEAA